MTFAEECAAGHKAAREKAEHRRRVLNHPTVVRAADRVQQLIEAVEAQSQRHGAATRLANEWRLRCVSKPGSDALHDSGTGRDDWQHHLWRMANDSWDQLERTQTAAVQAFAELQRAIEDADWFLSPEGRRKAEELADQERDIQAIEGPAEEQRNREANYEYEAEHARGYR